METALAINHPGNWSVNVAENGDRWVHVNGSEHGGASKGRFDNPMNRDPRIRFTASGVRYRE
jgi:hypothetical protein